MGPVQGDLDSTCDSSWALSAASLFESHLNIRADGTPKTISIQHIFDCDQNSNNNGCQGGTQYGAINFLITNGYFLSEEYHVKTFVGRKVGCQTKTNLLRKILTQISLKTKKNAKTIDIKRLL